MNTGINRQLIRNRGQRDRWDLESIRENFFGHRDYNEYLPRLCQLLETNEQVMRNLCENTTKKSIPIWEKKLLTLEEASALFGIGINKLRKLSDDDNCSFVLWNQSRRLIKREQLEKYLEKAYSV